MLNAAGPHQSSIFSADSRLKLWTSGKSTALALLTGVYALAFIKML
jgi:hypothetical protein